MALELQERWMIILECYAITIPQLIVINGWL